MGRVDREEEREREREERECVCELERQIEVMGRMVKSRAHEIMSWHGSLPDAPWSLTCKVLYFT